MEILYKEEAFAIIGASIEVHKELGCGFLEAVYQEALEIELKSKHIPFKSQHALSITYKGNYLQKEYVSDFICYDKIIVEIKALDRLSSKEESQILNYLKATDMKLGLLINFGSATTLEWKRFIR